MINLISRFFYFDQLAIIMTVLISFVGIVVGSFAYRYMKGDINYQRFFVLLVFLILSLLVMVCSNHIIVFIVAWGIGNLILVNLMIHKSSWQAAKASGILTLKDFILGFLLIGSAFYLLYSLTGSLFIKEIIISNTDSSLMQIALILLLSGSMTQSAIWPFHRWLISSLNSPSPISAIMHAGLINGGGFLLARFAPLFLSNQNILMLIFILGLVTSIIGTFWKLIQNDLKRMLACSTMGQMGFMFVQCGLGLFPAAIAHLCWHGLFKSYLFLASGNITQEKRLDLNYPPKLLNFIFSLLCGCAASICFTFASNSELSFTDTTIFLNLITLIAGAQFALLILKEKPILNFPLAILLSAIMGGFYGSNVYIIEYILIPLKITQPQALNIIHIIGMIILTLLWLIFIFSNKLIASSRIMKWIYVYALNTSQPEKITITANRNSYKYL